MMVYWVYCEVATNKSVFISNRGNSVIAKMIYYNMLFFSSTSEMEKKREQNREIVILHVLSFSFLTKQKYIKMIKIT
jgi:hypothetical protein